METEKQLKLLGLTLQTPPSPAGNYIPVTISNRLVITSGILPTENGKLTYKGKFPSVFSVEQGRSMAKTCILNALAIIKNAVSDLDKIKKVVKLTGYINSDKGFYEQSNVLNGASDLLIDIFGEKGKHTRSAIGVAELPLNSPIELELMLEI